MLDQTADATTADRYAAPSIRRTDRPDGSFVLTSTDRLLPHPPTLVHILAA